MPTAEEYNGAMVKVIPELNSPYAKYPLKEAAWTVPTGKINGEDAFIPYSKTADEPPMKKNYVWGPGGCGYGYYHLMTRYSYAILYARISKNRPATGCCCVASDPTQVSFDEWDDARTVVYNRSVASKPDDAQAKKDAYNIARGVAVAHYHEQQNVQLAIGVFQTGLNLSA